MRILDIVCIISFVCAQSKGNERKSNGVTAITNVKRESNIILSTASPGHSQATQYTADEDWRSTLFGEQGILTGLFRILDQQRKVAASSSDPSWKINDASKFDLKKIFEIIMKEDQGSFVGPESKFSEFLGLCNKLSCGDIYKSIDKFRRSELFVNFQTAMSLIQDPNGWEIIGKLLSNPDLISQFVAGTGMEELVGNALGDGKDSENRKEKQRNLTPDDGDFGTEFVDGTEENSSLNKKKHNREELPPIEFSVDGNDTDDYYEQVLEKVDETTDVIVSKATASTTIENSLPELSFSIDGDEEEVDASEISSIKTSEQNISELKSTESVPNEAEATTFTGIIVYKHTTVHEKGQFNTFNYCFNGYLDINTKAS